MHKKRIDQILMDPAIDVISRALQGDMSARSFLEQTSSIYVLDITDSSNPKTYGCWNLIHQAMNEVERHELQIAHPGIEAQSERALVGHARLLASMALRVARRSPSTDKSLVTTCISNSSNYTVSESQTQWLVDLNIELREIVMGRIAAMAFDFSFHRQTGLQSKSSFGDRVVMDTFCAVLAANAVSSGVVAIRHFLTEWIIPSSHDLPSFAVASVIQHLAYEGKRKTAPAGTKNALQQLSVAVMSLVLVPTMSEAVSDESNDFNYVIEQRSLVVAMCLRAIKMWCDATDLSLPQIKHICSKVNTDLVALLTDTMYSESHQVMNCLAELIESTIEISDQKVISEGKMNQVRHIMQVDDNAFKAQFTAQQLKTIESHEMTYIVDELVSAIGLQHFRFTERQKRGDIDLCRNLTTIAASVCGTWQDILDQNGQIHQSDSRSITLLLKAVGHPSVNICGIVLPVLTRMVQRMPSIALDLIPILQRKAIIPHRVTNAMISLDAVALCDVSYEEFQSFRDNILSNALVACWEASGERFMNSCTAAVEEFCSVSVNTVVYLQLEAALFCIETVADIARDSHNPFPYDTQLDKLMLALAKKPPSVMLNPLSRERMCSFLRKYMRWSIDHCRLKVGADLAFSCFQMTTEPIGDLQDDPHAPAPSVREACLTLKVYLSALAKTFLDADWFALLSVWETSYDAVHKQSNVISVDDRIALASGICQVLAEMSDNQFRIQAFEALASKPLELLDCMSQKAQDPKTTALELSSILPKIGNEILILSKMSRFFTNAINSVDSDQMQSGCGTSPDRLAQIPEPVLEIFRKRWSCISHAAANWLDDETVASSLAELLSNMLPPACETESQAKFLGELCSLAMTITQNTSKSGTQYAVLFTFIEAFVTVFGEDVEKESLATLSGSLTGKSHIQEVGRLLENLILGTVAAVHGKLDTQHIIIRKQGEGEDASEQKPTPKMQTRMERSSSMAGHYQKIEEDMLLRQTVDDAVISLNDMDPEITRNAILFLEALITHASSGFAKLQSFVSNSLLRIRTDTIKCLLVGSCGRYEYSLLDDVADLMVLLLRSGPSSDIHTILVTCLQHQKEFLLGDLAKTLTLSVLCRCGNDQHNPLRASDLAIFLKDIWWLHQVEDTNALPFSDEVARLLQQYG